MAVAIAPNGLKLMPLNEMTPNEPAEVLCDRDRMLAALSNPRTRLSEAAAEEIRRLVQEAREASIGDPAPS